MNIKLISDKVTVRGPKVDGSYVLNFEFGEYERKKIAELLSELRPDESVIITVEQDEISG